uniref:Uncharacterized protein n=1 Tax=Ditylenchus dipsaci TaxID=166011 RepID=A0A915E5U0_9BILA
MRDIVGREKSNHQSGAEGKQQDEARSAIRFASSHSVPDSEVKEEVLGAIDDSSQAKRARLKAGKHNQMKEAIIVWHKQVRSKNVSVTGELMKVKFFPSKTTALSHVADGSKRHTIPQAGNNYKVSLLDSLYLLRRAWGQVTEKTIRNCFRHADLIIMELTNKEEEADENGRAENQNKEFLNAWNELQAIGDILGRSCFFGIWDWDC